MKLRSFWLFLILLFVLASSFAQVPATSGKSGPPQGAAAERGDLRSVSETFEWIQQQIKFSGSSIDVSERDGKTPPWRHDTSYDNLQLAGCELKIDELTVSTIRGEAINRTAHLNIDLSDLVSSTYKLDEGSEQFKYTPPRPTIEFKSHTKSMHWTRPKSYFQTDSLEIRFGADPSFGEGKIKLLAKAFQHLADVCVPVESPAPTGKSAMTAPPQVTEQK